MVLRRLSESISLAKMSALKSHHALLAFGLVVIAGCGENDSSKKQKPPSVPEMKVTAEVRALTDSNRGLPEFVQRLRTVLKMSDGVLTVDDPLAFGLSVLSPNSPWVVNCGVGIEVVFESASTPGDRGGVKIQLALIPMTKEKCRELAPLVGKEVQAILAGR